MPQLKLDSETAGAKVRRRLLGLSFFPSDSQPECQEVLAGNCLAGKFRIVLHL